MPSLNNQIEALESQLRSLFVEWLDADSQTQKRILDDEIVILDKLNELDVHKWWL